MKPPLASSVIDVALNCGLSYGGAMSTAPMHLVEDVQRILSGIRASFDVPYSTRSELRADFDRVRGYYLRAEAARYAFRARVSRRPQDWDEWFVAAEELQDNLADLMQDRQFVDFAARRRFRLVPPDRRRRIALDPRFEEGDLTIADAILLLQETLPTGHPTAGEESGRASERLKRVVPEQRVSPVRFDIADGRLIVQPQPAVPPESDKQIIESAFGQLVQQGDRLLEELDRSNCDPRLRENVRQLQNQLVGQSDIIKLGLTNLGCAMMAEAFECELPDAVASMLRAQSVGVSMYVAQFPEWSEFSEKAAAVALDEEAVARISGAAQELTQTLTSDPSLAEPEVPRVIGFLNELIADPRKATKRAVFAVLRTIENIVIRVYQHSADCLEKTAKKTSDGLSTSLSKVAIAGLLGLALAAAVQLTPLAAHLPEMAWVGRATEIVRQQLEHLTR